MKLLNTFLVKDCVDIDSESLPGAVSTASRWHFFFSCRILHHFLIHTRSKFQSYKWFTAPQLVCTLTLSPCHSVIKTKGRAMEVVTHFVNDTVEFYKWSLTIAGKIFTKAVCRFRCTIIEKRLNHVSCYRCHTHYQENLVGSDEILVTSLVLEIVECTEKKRQVPIWLCYLSRRVSKIQRTCYIHYYYVLCLKMVWLHNKAWQVKVELQRLVQ